jgi:D-alanyl-D-alanine carboxypeptidase/D-alanyl-D-alanine-endopeptidase (penicillin-binding protein 4)
MRRIDDLDEEMSNARLQSFFKPLSTAGVLMASMLKIIALFFCFSSLGFADFNADLEKRLQQKIKQSDIKSDELAIYVSSGDKYRTTPLFSLNAEKAVIPASLSKIVTAGAALAELRPGTKFETRMMTTADMNARTLKGDLYLVGQGDPGFVSESMWNLVNEFVRNQITVIEGDIVVDDTWFDAIRRDPSREESEVDRAYNSPIGAMSFNWNAVNVFVRPGAKEGDAAQVFADPENAYIKVVNTAKTVATNKSTQLSVERVESREKGFLGDEIRVSGQIARSSLEKVFYKGITKPDLWSGFNLKAFLERRDVSVTGTIRVGKVPSSARILARVESQSVEKMVKDMMKYSNNYVAEMLVKQIAATKVSPPGSIPIGMQKVRQYIQTSGIRSGLEVENPSGLTRKNKFQAKALHDYLVALHGQFDIFAEGLSAYPLAGIDGTLERRMRGTPAQGWVRAKTGLLTGVSGLAGYAGRKDGQLLTFVFLFNGRADKGGSVRQLFDDLAVTLVQ